MNKPIIGIVGRENALTYLEDRSILSTDDNYRRAVIKSRWNSIRNITNTRLRISSLWFNRGQRFK